MNKVSFQQAFVNIKSSDLKCMPELFYILKYLHAYKIACLKLITVVFTFLHYGFTYVDIYYHCSVWVQRVRFYIKHNARKF